MKSFYDALRESIITQAVITVIVVAAWVFLEISGKPVPQDLTQVLFIVIGFYFGSKVGFRQGEQSLQSLVKKRSTDAEG